MLVAHELIMVAALASGSAWAQSSSSSRTDVHMDLGTRVSVFWKALTEDKPAETTPSADARKATDKTPDKAAVVRAAQRRQAAARAAALKAREDREASVKARREAEAERVRMMSQKLEEISVGMPVKEVLDRLGPPSEKTAIMGLEDGPRETLVYRLSGRAQIASIRVDAGKVTAISR